MDRMQEVRGRIKALLEIEWLRQAESGSEAIGYSFGGNYVMSPELMKR